MKMKITKAMLLLDLCVLGVLIAVASQQIYGSWDAWAMWNTKAEFLVSGEWQRIFSPHLAWMHPDYPLLLPLIVAGGWSIFNTQSPLIPLIVAVLFSWSAYLLVKNWVGVWAGLLMVSLPAFLRWSGSQYADIPLAVFLLLGISLLYQRKFLLSGFVFGLAIFTKNEGLMYFMLILMSFAYASWRVHKKIPLKTIALLGAGTLPGIAAFAIVKYYAPQSEFLTNVPNILSSISFQRILLILKEFIREFLVWKEWVAFWIIALLILIALRRRGRIDFWDTFFSTLIPLCFASYFLIYVSTPQDVAWHIQTSFNRLLIQILPLVIVAVFIRIKRINTPDTPQDIHLDTHGGSRVA